MQKRNLTANLYSADLDTGWLPSVAMFIYYWFHDIDGDNKCDHSWDDSCGDNCDDGCDDICDDNCDFITVIGQLGVSIPEAISMATDPRFPCKTNYLSHMALGVCWDGIL